MMIRLLNDLDIQHKEASGQHVIDCPECGKEGHCHVAPDTGLWHCKVCNARGNPCQLIGIYRPTSTPKERRELLERFDLKDSKGIREDSPKQKSFNPDMPGLREITVEDHAENFCEALGISAGSLPFFDPKTKNDHQNGKVIYLPAVPGKGQVCGYLRVRFDGKPYILQNGNTEKYPAIGKHGLLCAPWLQEQEPETLLFCEGWRDCSAAIDAGYYATASTGGASTWRDDWLPVFAGRNVVILMDSDTAGQNAASRAAEAIYGKAQSVKIVRLPYEVKDKHGEDLNDYLIRDKHSKDDLQKLIDSTEVYHKESQAKTNTGPQREPVLICLADVESKPVNWLWQDRFALGKLSALGGDCDLGKSFIVLNMAATLSQGLPLPGEYDYNREPAGSIILTAEDGLEDTIKPRLDAMDADCTKIVALRGTKLDDREKEFDLLRDVEQLRAAIKQVPNCQLIMIDPVSSYLGDIDTHRDAAVRSALRPLAEMADEMNVAIICISHLNKNGGGNAKYRITGSVAFTAFGRSAWMVCEDYEDDTGKRRFMLPIKNNLTEAKKNGLAYRIIDNALQWESDSVEMSAQDYISQQSPGTEPVERNEAEQFLRELLADGSLDAKEIYKQAKINDISKATLRRAKNTLGIKTSKIGYGKDSTWRWSLPQEDTQDDTV